MISGSQCRAARALIEWTRETLAAKSGVDPAIIERFERKLGKPEAEIVQALASALEAGGAIFIAENGGGAGVRLKFNRSETKRLATLENEGGISALDDVQ